MAFPTTGILDNFNRGNEGPPPSASWTADIYGDGVPAGEVLNNECAIDVGEAEFSQWWNVATFGPDSETYVTLVDEPDGAFLFLRLQTPGGAGVDGYELGTEADTSAIYRVDNGAETQLGAGVGQAFGDGDKFGFEVVGASLTGHIDAGGGWALYISRSDATYGSAGYIGPYYEGAAGDAMDDFGGGTIRIPRPPAAYNTLAIY